jgi:hypothetical protein
MSEEAYFSELETISQKADDESAAWEERTRDALANVTSAEEATEVLPLSSRMLVRSSRRLSTR